jgi:hypothetical protein
MDVKPENIGLEHDTFMLLDLNSAAPFEFFTDGTEVFVPSDFPVNSNGTMQASALLDKSMFAMTFFGKLVSHDGRTRQSGQI